MPPAIWQWWILINNLQCPWSHLLSIAPSMSVQVMLCPHSYCLSSVVFVCLCYFFHCILYVVHYVEFGQLSYCLHVQTIRVFAEWLCLTKLFGYLMVVFDRHRFLFSAVAIFRNQLIFFCRNKVFVLFPQPNFRSAQKNLFHATFRTQSTEPTNEPLRLTIISCLLVFSKPLIPATMVMLD